MKILGLILARGGSKRIPSKNIKPLGGKPLIAWTIETARYSEAFAKILVSTDDTSIAAVANEFGATVPWLRPAEYSADASPSIDAILHAVNWAEAEWGQFDGIMLLQPTSPFRTSESILKAVRMFRDNNLRPLASFSPVRAIPEWCFRETPDGLSPILGWDSTHQRSQDITPTIQLNGAIFIATPETLRRERCFVMPSTIPFLMADQRESLDIDTEEDWANAESYQTMNSWSNRDSAR